MKSFCIFTLLAASAYAQSTTVNPIRVRILNIGASSSVSAPYQNISAAAAPEPVTLTSVSTQIQHETKVETRVETSVQTSTTSLTATETTTELQKETVTYTQSPTTVTTITTSSALPETETATEVVTSTVVSTVASFPRPSDAISYFKGKVAAIKGSLPRPLGGY